MHTTIMSTIIRYVLGTNILKVSPSLHNTSLAASFAHDETHTQRKRIIEAEKSVVATGSPIIDDSATAPEALTPVYLSLPNQSSTSVATNTTITIAITTTTTEATKSSDYKVKVHIEDSISEQHTRAPSTTSPNHTTNTQQNLVSKRRADVERIEKKYESGVRPICGARKVRGAMMCAIGRKHGSAVRVKPLPKKKLLDRWYIDGENSEGLEKTETRVVSAGNVIRRIERGVLRELKTGRNAAKEFKAYTNGVVPVGGIEKVKNALCSVGRKHGRAIMVKSAGLGSRERTQEWVVDIDLE